MKNIDLTFFNTLKIRLQESKNGEIFHKLFLPKNRDFFLVDDEKAQKFKKSAVLLLLYYRNDRLKSVLIQRPAYNGAHSNQISLPGGKYEDNDETLINTAIRETFEEISVKSNCEDVLGSLTPLAIPISRFVVFPFISFLHFAPTIIIDEREVIESIEFDIHDFLFHTDIIIREVNAIDQLLTVPAFTINNRVVWGATAMILNEFREIALKSLELENEE